MKKLFLLLALALPMLCNAQFTLTPEGFKSDGKDYYVADVEGSQAELFNRAKLAITQAFVSAKDAATFSEPTIISVRGFCNDIAIKDGPMTAYLDMEYTLKIMFKDGKVRFDAPQVLKLYKYNNGRDLNMYLGCGGGPGFSGYGYIFKKNGEVRNAMAVKSLEAFFNSTINSLVKSIKNPVTEEDW